MTLVSTIPEEEWKKIQTLSDTIKRKVWNIENDIENLDNLLHALHGEGIRNRKYTTSGYPQVFQDGEWIDR